MTPTLHPVDDDLVPSQLLTDFRAAGARLADELLGTQAEAAAIAALDKAVQALRGVHADERPAHVVYLLRQLDMNDNDLTAVFREIDDRLAWGKWRD